MKSYLIKGNVINSFCKLVTLMFIGQINHMYKPLLGNFIAAMYFQLFNNRLKCREIKLNKGNNNKNTCNSIR